MLDRLELILKECVAKSALYSDSIDSLNENRHTLKQRGALAVVDGHLGNASTKVVQKAEPRVIDRPLRVFMATGIKIYVSAAHILQSFIRQPPPLPH